MKRGILIAVVFGLFAGFASPAADGNLTDDILAMQLPRGWHGSVCFGQTSYGAAAYLFAGNFRFHASCHDAGPAVRRHKVLISIGDFPWRARGRGPWPSVERLRLPRKLKRDVSWQVRFHHRALYLSIEFGSRPTTRIRRIVNRRLASVRRLG